MHDLDCLDFEAVGRDVVDSHSRRVDGERRRAASNRKAGQTRFRPVEIADEETRRGAFPQRVDNSLELRDVLIGANRQVRDGDRDVERPRQQHTARFAPAPKLDGLDLRQPVARQQRIAVPTTGYCDGHPERGVHSCGASHNIHQVSAVGAGDLHVDLLQADDVGIEARARLAEPIEINAAVAPPAVLDVERRDSK